MTFEVHSSFNALVVHGFLLPSSLPLYHVLLVCSPGDGDLDCVQFLAVALDAALTACVPTTVCVDVCWHFSSAEF